MKNSSEAKYGSIESTSTFSYREDEDNIEMGGRHKDPNDDVDFFPDRRVSFRDDVKAWKFSKRDPEFGRSSSTSMGCPDAHRLSQAVRDAGYYAFGVVAVEVWVLDEANGRFFRADGGWWRNRLFETSEALSRIEDSCHPEYVPPLQQIAGAGLAGYFWANSLISRSALRAPRRRSSSPSVLGRRRVSWSTPKLEEQTLTWVHLSAITSDPDQPPYLRMRVLEEAGFGKAAGAAFNVHGHKGVVVYLARHTADDGMLREKENDDYLRRAAEHIGMTYSLGESRRASVHAKEQRTHRKLKNACSKLSAVRAFARLRMPFSGFQSVAPAQGEQLDRESSVGEIKKKISVLFEKCWGGNLKPPPPMGTGEACWTFFGSYATLFIITELNALIEKRTNDSYGIILGPFGALMTLQYGLTQAPAAQPRNAMYGQFVSMSIALLLKNALPAKSPLGPNLRAVVATSAAVAFMAKLGITHPPAASSAWILSSMQVVKWQLFAMMLFGNGVAIFLSTFLNNLSERRQYPIYWNLWPRAKGDNKY